MKNMIQIRRVRAYIPKGEDKEKRFDKPLPTDIIIENHHALFKDLDKYIAMIPVEERWNLYYTLGYGPCTVQRVWSGQDIVPFDIDGITIADDGSFDPRYVALALKALNVDETKTVVVCSGNGLQILVQIPEMINTQKWFEENRLNYKLCLNLIQKEYEDAGLVWTADPSSFAPNRVFRLPGTENRKPGKKTRKARLLSSNLEPQTWSFETLLKIPKVKPEEEVTTTQLKRFAVDVPAVEEGCDFLKWCKAHQDEQTEPIWYAMTSIVARLRGQEESEEDARKRVHDYSSLHPAYTPSETDRKIDQALAGSGPRTCENVESLWDGCEGCANYKQVNSPISIKGADFIATEHTGFYMMGAKGGLIPQYEDLRKYLDKTHHYKVEKNSGMVYGWDKTHYTVWNDLAMKNFTERHFHPKPADRISSEFVCWVRRTNHIEASWFTASCLDKINFLNGVLDVKTGKMLEHSHEFGFRYVLPFEYQSEAKSPLFDKFLKEILSGDDNLETLVLEYLGYALCSPDYWIQKSLLLVGDGANGKSTLLDIVKALAGLENISYLSLGELQSETGRINLEGKLINIADELPSYNFKNTEMLKKLMGGGMTARKLYHETVMLENKTKFIFACNDIPTTNDFSKGLFRRLTIIPFKETFDIGVNADPQLKEKIYPELSGIFNRVFAAFKNLKARGHLHHSKTSEDELTLYKESVDRVGYWVKENLHWNGSWTEHDKYIQINEAYEAYFTEAKKCEEKPVTKFHFTRHLRRHIDHWEERYVRARVGETRPYIIRGAWFNKDEHGFGPTDQY